MKYVYGVPEFICHRKNMKLPANNSAPDGKRAQVSQYQVMAGLKSITSSQELLQLGFALKI